MAHRPGFDTSVFHDPPVEFRSAPLWAWNDRLTDAELRRQIRQMHDQGFGGFFMHPREGMQTPYLSDEFFARVATCVKEAKRLGMKAWVYDEDRWPSGMAGGRVAAESPKHRLHALRLRPVELPGAEPRGIEPALRDVRVLRTFAVRAQDQKLEAFRGWDLAKPAESGWQVMALVSGEMPPEPWYHHQPYVSFFDPGTVRSFLRHTHEAYAKRFRAEFGKTIPGVFTDEVCLFHSLIWWPQTVTWHERVPRLFQRRFGYDLLDAAPLLFLDGEGSAKVRFHFWQLLTDLLVDGFAKPAGRWCGKRKLSLAGHYEDEEPFTGQVLRTGASMLHYEHFQIPGFDSLAKGNNITAIGAKQCTSVANQWDKRRVVCELHGAAGWDYDFAGQKREGDRMLVYGANLLNPHFTSYSIRGPRKRDFPPFFSEQQPWWPRYHVLADYFARVSAMLSQGRYVADCAVLHPINTAWSLIGVGGSDELPRYERPFRELAEWLMRKQVSFDFIDETLLARHGRVIRASLRMPAMRYPLLVLPPMLVMRSTTLALLKRWVRGGGRVIAIEPVATLLDAERSLDLRGELPAMEVFATPDQRLAGLLRRDASVRVTSADGGEAADVLIHLRQLDEERLLFLSNQHEAEGVDLRVSVPGEFDAEELDPFSGEARAAGDGAAWTGRIEAAGSVLLRLTRRGSRSAKPQPTKAAEEGIEEQIPGPWRVAFDGPNALLLDRCRYRFVTPGVEAAWEGPVYVFEAQEAAEHRGADGGTELLFAFESRLASQADIDLAIEAPETFEIVLNGRRVTGKTRGSWLDRSIRRLPIGRWLRRGRNELLLRTRFIQPPNARKPNYLPFVPGGTELENLFLLGDFTVSLADRVPTLRPPKPVRGVGDLSRQGYPFYAGVVRYTAAITGDGSPARLRAPELTAPYAEVSCNGSRPTSIFLPPHAAALPRWRRGRNEVTITLFGSARNAFGPHHSSDTNPMIWRQFGRHPRWTDAYRVAPFGLLSPPRLIRS